MPDPSRFIYKIFRAGEWRSLESAGSTKGARIDLTDGFIHFSTADQAAETAAKHFANEADLVLVQCDGSAMSDLKWEPSRGGALFPHLYRALEMAEVVRSGPLPLVGGSHAFPDWFE